MFNKLTKNLSVTEHSNLSVQPNNAEEPKQVTGMSINWINISIWATAHLPLP